VRLVERETSRHWSGLHTGWAGDQPLGTGLSEVFAGLEQSVLVLGPPRCGKTSSVVVPSVVAAPGALVSTSTKPDVLEVTGRWRAEWGTCFVFDPSGTTRVPEHARPLRWSPVQGAESWETAVSTAHALASAARPGASLSEAAHWVERAEALIAPLLHAAALAERTLADVMGWVLSHELRQPARILEARAGDMARIVLAGIVGTEERERSGILSTAAGLLGAYRSEAALRAACAPNFDPVGFSYSGDTVYVTAPGHAQDQLAPLVVTILEQIRRAAYARPPDACPVVFALDEVAQIAPLPSLPQLAAEGGGQGVVTLACLQDLSQARVRWGEAADGFFSLFSTKLVFPGIGDRFTLELVCAIAGESEVPTRAVTKTPPLQALITGRFELHETRSTIWRPRLPVDEVARGRPGHALHIRPDEALSFVRVLPYWEVETLSRAVTAAGASSDGRATGQSR